MRYLTLIYIIASSFSLNAQGVWNYLKDNKVSLSCMFAAGTLDGTVEILKHDYKNFKRVFPNANDEFWNPDISWRNKWKGGDRANGEAFLFSSTSLAWTTDGYHLLRTGQRMAIFAGVTFKIVEDKPRKFKDYVFDFAAHSLAYTAGFNLSYEIVFNH